MKYSKKHVLIVMLVSIMLIISGCTKEVDGYTKVATGYYQEIVDAGKLDQLKDIVSELYPDSIDATTLNDLIWFEYDFLKEVLGMEQDVEEEQ